MNWIIKIISKEPFKVTCRWNDQIIRTIDLEAFLRRKSTKPFNSYSQLLDKERFLEVKCDGTTLYWDKGIIMTDVNGRQQPAPLDIDPDVLFNMTIPTTAKKKNRKTVQKPE
jgi:hypothetical protein